jgi:hypothetical protein
MTAAHSGHTFPHGSLALNSQGHSEGKSEDGERSKAAEVEEEALDLVRGASLVQLFDRQAPPRASG